MSYDVLITALFHMNQSVSTLMSFVFRLQVERWGTDVMFTHYKRKTTNRKR